MCIGGEELLPIRERLAQLVEQLAQVVARLGLGCVGPEEEGEMLALLGNIPMQHEIREQRTQAHGIEASDRLAVVEQDEIAKYAKAKGWHRHDRPRFSTPGSSDGRVVSARSTRKQGHEATGSQRNHDLAMCPITRGLPR
jgi:hypothetical protein